MNKRKLAIVSTHPIQYYAPIFKLLNERKRIQIKVFYTWPEAIEGFVDEGFKKRINWDIPLLDNYHYELVPNTAKHPGSKTYSGIKNPDLNKRVEEYDPQAILLFGWNLHSHFTLMKYIKGKIPVWFRGDSTLLDEEKGIKLILRRLWLSWVYRYIDKAFFVGKSNKAYFLAHGVSEKQLVHAPHAIDNARFSSITDESKEHVATIRRNHQLSENDRVFLFVGKFEPKKDPLLLLKAFKELKLKNIHLFFVGNGVLEGNLKRAASGVNNIHFLPFQNQKLMPAIYQLSDVLVLPSKGPGETWGLAVNEAMAVGKAILVSEKVGCAMDLVRPSLNGYIFKSNDKEDLKDKLNLLCQEDLKAMGKKSQDIIQDYSFENICFALEEELFKLG